MQAKNNRRVLNCWWLGLGCSAAGLFLRRSRGNDGGLKILSRGRRQMLPGRQPLIEFGLASDAAAEDLALQFGEFEFPVGDRVVGTERSFRKRDLTVLPGEITDCEQTVADELVERPVTMSLEFEYTGAQVAEAGDGGGFIEVELAFVGALHV